MEVVSLKVENMKDYGKESVGLVYSLHVKVTDIEARATEMVATISNTSWIGELGAVAQASYAARAQATIIKLVNLIVDREENSVSEAFGEFVVSDSAQSVLGSELGHIRVPLAELLKEKITGNPGFDFHTETGSQHVTFGEAKYSGKGNPHGKALSQIGDFIIKKKDIQEIIDLKNFVSAPAIDNSMNGNKAYAAAFSVNNEDPQKIIKNALKSKFIDDLLCYPELFIIGVEVNA